MQHKETSVRSLGGENSPLPRSRILRGRINGVRHRRRQNQHCSKLSWIVKKVFASNRAVLHAKGGENICGSFRSDDRLTHQYRLSTIYFAPMPHFDYNEQQNLVLNQIENSIIADSNPIKVILASWRFCINGRRAIAPVAMKSPKLRRSFLRFYKGIGEISQNCVDAIIANMR
jgi:hypothetical protein